MSQSGSIMASGGRPVNRVKKHRLSRGWTQSQLGERTGISRSAITAIEAERLSPSVTAALALAQAFSLTVEDLFGEHPIESDRVWAWEPSGGIARAWQAEVSGRQILYPATTASCLAELPDWIGGEPTRPHCQSAEDTLVVATCDPAAGILSRYFTETSGMRMLVLPRSSDQSLEMLQQGLVHLAGLHLSTQEAPQENASRAWNALGQPCQLLRIAQWQEGIAVSSNTKLRSVRSVLKSKLSWIGRDVGSGAGQCLKRLFDGRPLPQRNARDHRSVGEAIHSGWADAGVCHQLIADELGLGFLSVQEEDYDVCYPSVMSGDHRIEALLAVVRSPAYRQLLAGLPGISSRQTGDLRPVDSHHPKG